MNSDRRGLSPAVAVVGPTASGKTALALELARKFGGEIVSADSRQLYRGTDVCTDIPSGCWRSVDGRRFYEVEGVPHYLLGSESPDRPVDLAEYKRQAAWHLHEIAARGRLPLLVGGTGLYVRAVIDNFVGPAVGADPELRTRLEKLSTETLHQQLQEVDPDYAKRIEPNNRRYVIRGLEVFQLTGQPVSVQQPVGQPLFSWLQLGVTRDRSELYRRIDERVDWMVENGLIDETKRILDRYGAGSRIASSLGYAQLGPHFSGEYDLSEAIRLIKRETRHYARRQLTWLRRDYRIKWVEGFEKAAEEVKKLTFG